MSLHIIVRERRKKLGLTQEQLADYLGVSAPAVNKWEKGATYPDVTLLPALARLLKTDLNTLLCFHEEMSQKEIGLFLNSITEVFHKDGFAAAFTMAMQKVREYPASAALLHALAMVLQGSLMMANVTKEQKQAYEAQITMLYQRVAESNDPQYADAANYMLASRLITAEEYDKAQEALDALPEHNALDKRTLQAQLWLAQGKNKEAAELVEHKALASLQQLQTALASLAKIAVLEGDEQNATQLAQCAQKTVTLFGLWEYGSFVVPLETAVLRKDVAGSLAALQDILASALLPWDIKKSPICRHIQQKPQEKGLGAQFLPSILLELENSPEYEFIRKEPAFQALLQQYRAKC